MNESMLAYVAGFFDAEGSVGVYKRAGYFALHASIGQQPPCPVLYTIQDCFGGSIYNGKGGVEIWGIGDNKALAFLEAIQPFLCLPRKVAQVEIAIQFQIRKIAANCQSSSISPSELKYREDIYWTLRELKRKSLSVVSITDEQASLDYIAGFFDGDGTTGIYRMRKYYVLKVQIVQKEPCPLLDNLCKRYGGSLHKMRQNIIKWNIGSNQALHFLQSVGSCLRLPQKVAEAKLAIQFQSYRLRRAGHFSQSEPLSQNDRDYYVAMAAKMKACKA